MPCQVVNDTQLRLEVALVEAQRRSSARSASGFSRADSMVRVLRLMSAQKCNAHERQSKHCFLVFIVA